MKKIKQLFCSHLYVLRLDSEPFYCSVGDKAHNRQSKRYYLVCQKCSKNIEVIKHWDTDRIEKYCFE